MGLQKIVHIIYNLKTGGAEKLLVDTLIECKNKNLQVELVVLNNIEVDSFLVQKLNIATIPIHYFEKTYSKYSLNLFFAIQKKIATIKPDLIHVHLFPSFYYVAFWKYFYASKLPLIYTEHSTNNKRRKIEGLKYIELWMYKKYNTIICISNGVKENLANHIQLNNCQVIPNGVNFKTLFENKNEETLNIVKQLTSENKIILLAIGRLVLEKNHAFLLSLMEMLPSNFVLLICGDGKERKNLENKIIKKNLINSVYLLGNQQNISSIIINSTIGIMPSLYEGFGLAAIEMMALGLPVFLHNVSGLNELASSSELLFSLKEIEQLKAKIIHLTTNKTLYKKYSQLARTKAKEYSIEKMVMAYIELYSTIK